MRMVFKCGSKEATEKNHVVNFEKHKLLTDIRNYISITYEHLVQMCDVGWIYVEILCAFKNSMIFALF